MKCGMCSTERVIIHAKTSWGLFSLLATGCLGSLSKSHVLFKRCGGLYVYVFTVDCDYAKTLPSLCNSGNYKPVVLWVVTILLNTISLACTGKVRSIDNLYFIYDLYYYASKMLKFI